MTDLPEVRLDPRTGIFWAKLGEAGSVVRLTDAKTFQRTREVTYGTWICWERIGAPEWHEEAPRHAQS